jgi:hypothetical protein
MAVFRRRHAEQFPSTDGPTRVIRSLGAAVSGKDDTNLERPGP